LRVAPEGLSVQKSASQEAQDICSRSARKGDELTSDSDQTATDSYVLDEQVGYALRLASQRHALIFQAHALETLTPTQFAALIRINEQGPCSQNHLGRLISIDVATIKGVVDRLRKKGLVELTPDESDRRRTTIALSPVAQAMMEALERMGSIITEETLRPLTKTEQVTLLRLLQKIA